MSNMKGKRSLQTKFEDIVDVKEIGGKNTKKMNHIMNLANQERLTPIKDNDSVLLIGIDFQNDFMENGELGVPGSHGDVERFTKFMYNNMDVITRIAVSIDTHQPHQIFHPGWWIGKDGKTPPPFTVITVEDLDRGTWKPVIRMEESRNYVEKLQEQANRPLIIWPYHCIEGTEGCALEGQFANMVYFHSVAKRSMPIRLVKGTDRLSEMYGIVKPEYTKQNVINLTLLNEIEKNSKIIIGGEAKSHCVLESVRQILEYFEMKPEVTSKIYILEDCMSSIPGTEEETEVCFQEFKAKYHVNIVKSTEFQL